MVGTYLSYLPVMLGLLAVHFRRMRSVSANLLRPYLVCFNNLFHAQHQHNVLISTDPTFDITPYINRAHRTQQVWSRNSH